MLISKLNHAIVSDMAISKVFWQSSITDYREYIVFFAWKIYWGIHVEHEKIIVISSVKNDGIS